MRTPVIKRVQLKKRKFNLDLKNHLDLAINSMCINNRIYKSPEFQGQRIYLPGGKTCLKLYTLGDELFVYLSDKKIYKLNDMQFNLVVDKIFMETPKLATVPHNGKKAILIVSSNNSLLVGKDEQGNEEQLQVDIPVCDDYVLYAGMLLGLTASKIYFSKPFEYVNFSEGGLINIERRAGKALKLFKTDNQLYVICKNLIYTLSPFGDYEEFTIKLVDTGYLNILENSVVHLSDKVAFISENKIVAFDGVKVKKYHSFLDNQNITVSDECKAIDNGIIIPIKIEEYPTNDYLLIYDFKDCVQFIIKNVGKVCDKLGYSINFESGELYKISGDYKESSQAIIKFYPQDFETLNQKFISKIYINSSGTYLLKSSGDFGDKTFIINSGINEILCNLSSREFNFTIISNDVKFGIKDVQFIYDEKGEI